jgi:cytochrome c oxidase subunit 2
MSALLALQAAAPQAPAAAAPAAAAPTAEALAGTTAPAEFLPQASSFAPPVDDAFLVLLWFATFLSIVIAGAFALLSWRGSEEADRPLLPRSSTRWAAVSAILLVAAFFVQGTRVRADMDVVPRGALPIRVAVQDGAFVFAYPNGYATGELHLPLGRPVRFVFDGAAEPYTFSAPAFRLQVAVPIGTRREAWVQATLAGEYTVRSTRTALKAGPALSAQSVVHDEGGFDKWYQDISGPPLDLPPLELGQRSYQMRGCTQCHSIDGSPLIGPSFKGFLAREHRMQDGAVVEPTDAYVAESLLDPQARIVEGFEPVMPSFRGRLHELEVAGLAAYIKSLQ